MPKKKRLDLLLVDQGFAENPDAAKRLIGAGQVLVGTRSDYKAGSLISVECELTVKRRPRFVSRGGDKLEGGLNGLGVDPRGWICADIGCSTGGFTDCLLQRGAEKVYCVDVGYGLLDWKLRQNDRVVVLERTNARYLSDEHISDPLDFAVIDASFISLQQLIVPLVPLFGQEIRIMALVKPQFELPREKVGPGGIVRESGLHEEAMDRVRQFASDAGLLFRGGVASPICGAKGNQEFLLYFTSRK
ncbi:MAG: TlyA family rRNA (cytidine-2'-O)-methyltransferase [Desulfobulbus sp.]|nr:MAG: TlyA family rRNA (cytidine-2'-O)-methyltransferase [Desulfobulbus sp.]RUM38766.1 MAG: TlyA family rRNA (cytidine-2'-O)-methyltransferase [Desulfobulbus sp.]